MSETAIKNSSVMSAAAGAEAAVRRNRALKWMDVGVLLGALLIFFVFLNVLVHVVFPQGSRLMETVAVENQDISETGDRGAIEIAGTAGDFSIFKAFLGDVRRDVKIRPANGVAWTSAIKGSAVHDRDAVQTFSNSRARVDFTTENKLRIGQNSLVVFRNGAADPFLARREAAVVVMDGELSGEVNADYGAFAIEFPAGLVELTADKSSKEAVNFRVSVNPDQSSTIAVYSGQADINIAGEHFKVAANEGITFGKDGATVGVMGLPTLPDVRAPSSNSAAKFMNTPPRVAFRWRDVENAKKYRLEIAQDKGFEEILVDESLENNSFVHGNLPEGEYFWRVSALNGWVQGPTSEARRLRIVRDAEPPVLELEAVERLTASLYLLRGSTSRDAQVFAFGEPVGTTPDGRFEYQFSPAPGTQTIVVESVDDVGNTTYSSQLLHIPGSTGRGQQP
ncbi:MAG: hypothetical protein WBN34_10515 [Woeseia sp.]